jgi:hypothetical protein
MIHLRDAETQRKKLKSIHRKGAKKYQFYSLPMARNFFDNQSIFAPLR